MPLLIDRHFLSFAVAPRIESPTLATHNVRNVATKSRGNERTETGERLNVLHEVTEKEVLTPEEAKRVILAAKPGLYRTVIQTAIYTGARISELLALRWQDVKLDGGVIEIRRSMSTARLKGEAAQEKHRWFDPKTKHGIREIPIPPQLVSALSEWMGKGPKSRLDLVFVTSSANPATVRE